MQKSGIEYHKKNIKRTLFATLYFAQFQWTSHEQYSSFFFRGVVASRITIIVFPFYLYSLEDVDRRSVGRRTTSKKSEVSEKETDTKKIHLGFVEHLKPMKLFNYNCNFITHTHAGIFCCPLLIGLLMRIYESLLNLNPIEFISE